MFGKFSVRQFVQIRIFIVEIFQIVIFLLIHFFKTPIIAPFIRIFFFLLHWLFNGCSLNYRLLRLSRNCGGLLSFVLIVCKVKQIVSIEVVVVFLFFEIVFKVIRIVKIFKLNHFFLLDLIS